MRSVSLRLKPPATAPARSRIRSATVRLLPPAASCHLRKDGAIERGAPGVPGHCPRRPRLSQNLVQFLANFFRIGMIFRRFEIVVGRISAVVSKEIALAGSAMSSLYTNPTRDAPM
jgi:hypothetical protein